ncbi:hypothetical protein [Streptosporangium sandarakinum]|uniref:hypothetical protein n=1 Tax=Streptosporangium sandarakinum TaxID=1260955 RepID=UPI003713B6FA
MLPTVKPRRLLPFLLIAVTLFFIVREPAKAATATTAAFSGLVTVVDALATFAGNLG